MVRVPKKSGKTNTYAVDCVDGFEQRTTEWVWHSQPADMIFKGYRACLMTGARMWRVMTHERLVKTVGWQMFKIE